MELLDPLGVVPPLSLHHFPVIVHVIAPLVGAEKETTSCTLDHEVFGPSFVDLIDRLVEAEASPDG